MERILLCLLLTLATVSSYEFLPWSYTCDKYSRCVKGAAVKPGEEGAAMSLGRCKLTCGEDNVLWPKPRQAKLGKQVTAVSPKDVRILNEADFKGSETFQLLKRGIDDQVRWVLKKKPSKAVPKEVGVVFGVRIVIENYADGTPRIKRDTNESYSLKISYSDEEKAVTAVINANTYFGARHGLETLFQLVEYDDVERHFVVLSEVDIANDHPEFVHRGLSLDTSRNFIEPDVIRRTLDGMSHAKLNVLHWHIVDTHSFPVELKGDPIRQMTQYGAYDPDKIYSQETVKEIVDYANYRGIRVIPELDQPAHVGNGWQFPGAEDLTVCRNIEPWYKYCVEPPCGQLNPTKPRVYDLLEQIYGEFYDMFGGFDSFHMGADEVHFGCWNSTKEVTDYMDNEVLLEERDEAAFIALWSDFQKKSSDRLKKIMKEKNPKSAKDLELIVWTSHLTYEKYIHHLPTGEYAVQIWTNGSDVKDPQIKVLADKGYRMIFTNFDALYLDCGYGAWVGKGNNWCTPYKGWQKVYENDLYAMLEKRHVVLSESKKKQVLGGEVAMWSEQVDSATLEAKVFPRASALAERLWSNPEAGSWYKAQQRMLQHRWRLTHRGVAADALQPEWCRINDGQCYAREDNPLPVVGPNKYLWEVTEL